MKKPLAVLTVALLLAAALAQDAAPPPQPSLEIRMSLVESRLTRVEADVSQLSGVPTQLARIEEKLTALAEKTDSQGGVLQQLGLSTATLLLGAGIGVLVKSKKV